MLSLSLTTTSLLISGMPLKAPLFLLWSLLLFCLLLTLGPEGGLFSLLLLFVASESLLI